MLYVFLPTVGLLKNTICPLIAPKNIYMQSWEESIYYLTSDSVLQYEAVYFCRCLLSLHNGTALVKIGLYHGLRAHDLWAVQRW